MTNIKLIVTDMDHTLLTEQGMVPPGFHEAVLELHRRGIAVAIASGRPLYNLIEHFPDLLDILWLVSDNGGVIYHKGEFVYKSHMPVADYQMLLQYAIENIDGFPILCAYDGAYLPQKAKAHDCFFRQFFSAITYVDDVRELTAEANKCTYFFPAHDSKACYEQKVKPAFGASFSVVVTDLMWIDLMQKGIHKGFALKQLQQLLSVNQSEILAFGDNYNDREMLHEAKYSFAVENAVEGLLPFAAYRAESNEAHGVLQVITAVLDGSFDAYCASHQNHSAHANNLR